jgi:hypothetical protein
MIQATERVKHTTHKRKTPARFSKSPLTPAFPPVPVLHQARKPILDDGTKPAARLTRLGIDLQSRLRKSIDVTEYVKSARQMLCSCRRMGILVQDKTTHCAEYSPSKINSGKCPHPF